MGDGLAGKGTVRDRSAEEIHAVHARRAQAQRRPINGLFQVETTPRRNDEKTRLLWNALTALVGEKKRLRGCVDPPAYQLRLPLDVHSLYSPGLGA